LAGDGSTWGKDPAIIPPQAASNKNGTEPGRRRAPGCVPKAAVFSTEEIRHRCFMGTPFMVSCDHCYAAVTVQGLCVDEVEGSWFRSVVCHAVGEGHDAHLAALQQTEHHTACQEGNSA
jgi:hypothetical protein